MSRDPICGEILTIQELGSATFVCDLAPDHEAEDEGMHSSTDVTKDPVPIQFNMLWGTVDYDTA